MSLQDFKLSVPLSLLRAFGTGAAAAYALAYLVWGFMTYAVLILWSSVDLDVVGIGATSTGIAVIFSLPILSVFVYRSRRMSMVRDKSGASAARAVMMFFHFIYTTGMLAGALVLLAID
jgi:apolipoprotein N-acyltransferase